METIGIDHGNAAMKTRSFCFPAGVAEYEHEPYTRKDVLKYNGKYYVCGTGRQPFLRDKTADQRYYLLTLAAMAKELEKRKLPSPAGVRIAAGLPLTNYGKEKNRFRAYLLSGPQPVQFQYEGRPYEIHIKDVALFPQAYAALSLRMDLLKNEPSVIVADIGGWTVDVMRLDHGVPDASGCRSLELGMIRCMDEIAEQVRRSVGLSVTAVQIETVLQNISEQMELLRTMVNQLRLLLERTATGDGDINILNQEIVRINDQIHAIHRLYSMKLFDIGTFQERTNALQARLQELQGKRKILIAGLAQDDALEKTKQIISTLQEIDIESEKDIQRGFLQIVDKVLVNQEKKVTFHLINGLKLVGWEHEKGWHGANGTE